MRIANNVNCRRALVLGGSHTVIDESPTKACAPDAGFNKQTVELRIAVFAAKNRGEAADHAIHFRNKNLATHDLLKRELDRIGIGKNRLSITSVVNRSAELQRLECLPLGDYRRSNYNAAGHMFFCLTL